MKLFYCYFWLRQDGTPYYVGKGYGERGFISDAHCVKRPKEKNRIIVQEYECEKDAFEAEIFFIAFFGRIDLKTGCLRNMTDGGDGPSGYKHTAEAKSKISKTHSGVTLSSERKKKMSATRKQWWIENPEERKKRSEAKMGVPMSESVKDTLKEIRNTPEYKQQQSLNLTARWEDSSSRNVLCQSMRKPKSEEGRKAIAEARKNELPEKKKRRSRKVWESRRKNKLKEIRKWITDGTMDKLVENIEFPPSGWKFGRVKLMIAANRRKDQQKPTILQLNPVLL